jgi:hypothetical protein
VQLHNAAKPQCKPNTTYTLSAYIYHEAGITLTDFGVKGENCDAAGTLISGTYNLTVGSVPSGVWTRISQVFTTSADAQRINACFFEQFPVNGRAFYVDGAMIEEGATLGTYFDGSFPGCAWADPITGIAGTAHASPSISKAAFWVEEGTTNLLLNPSAETGLTNIGPWGTATRTQSSVAAYLGTSSVEVMTAATSDGVAFLTSTGLASTGETFTGQVRVRAKTSADVGKLVNVRFYPTYTDATSENFGGPTQVSLTNSWQLVTITATFRSDKTIDLLRILVQAASAAAPSFYADCAQIEKKPYATSYCDGSLGTGYTWAGTAHASASTRALTTLKVDEGSRISSLRGTLNTVINRLVDAGASQYIFDVGEDTAGKDRLRMLVALGDNLSSDFRTNGGAPAITGSSNIVSVGQWFSAYETWDGTVTRVGVVGGTESASTRAVPNGNLTSTNDLAIGSGNNNLLPFNGLIGPVAIFDRPLTSAELTVLQNTDPVNWWSALA